MTMHVGLIGGGNISETHARAINAIPDLELSAVYGTNSEKVRRLCREAGGVPFDQLEAFLDHRPMELVAIGSPSGLHAMHGIAAARRGLHVLTEKPIDISTARADELIAAADNAGVTLGVVFQDRFKPDIRRLRRWIAEGMIGKPLLIDARVKWYRPPDYYGESKWRGTLDLDGGGALINQAIHTVDLLLWIFGDVVQVQAQTATMLHAIQGEDLATALLTFANGARGVLQATTAAFPGYPRRIEITGTEGSVTLEQDRIVTVNLKNGSTDAIANPPSADTENVSTPVVSDFTGHQAIFEDFLRAIRDHGKPVCDGREGRRSIALVEQIYRASKTANGLSAH
jgi:UDP-N-acetyl-2-amino-2-deoxyglucuronate dehydrogenase